MTLTAPILVTYNLTPPQKKNKKQFKPYQNIKWPTNEHHQTMLNPRCGFWSFWIIHLRIIHPIWWLVVTGIIDLLFSADHGKTGYGKWWLWKWQLFVNIDWYTCHRIILCLSKWFHAESKSGRLPQILGGPHAMQKHHLSQNAMDKIHTWSPPSKRDTQKQATFTVFFSHVFFLRLWWVHGRCQIC